MTVLEILKAFRPASGTMRLEGTAAWVARMVWVILAVPMIVLFFAGIPNAYRLLLVVFPETARALARVKLTVPMYAFYTVGLDVVTFSLMSAIAILLMLRRSNDRIVILVALMLVATGMVYTVPAYEAHAPAWIIGTLVAIGEICQVVFFFVFPNGQFLPRIAWLLVPIMLIWRPLVWIVSYIPNYYAAIQTGENYGGLRQDLFQILIMLALFFIGISTQVYRYRRISDNTQRQQTKWLLFGITLAFLLATPYVLGVNVFGLATRPGESTLFVRLLGRTLRQVAFCLIPITLVFSMLRYRLWEVDRLLNRTLVYTVLTAALGALYVGSIFLLQQLFRAITGVPNSVLVIVISTIGIAALFEPLRQFLTQVINKRFFRAKYDADQTLAAFSLVLQNEVDLERVKAHLANAAESALQPEHISVWVPHRTQNVQ